jgi:hypothetical protein
MRRAFIICLFFGVIFNSAAADEFRVNTFRSYDQTDAAVAMQADSGFVVVWSSYRQDGSSNGIFAQRFDPNCEPAGEEIQINHNISGNQTEPSVATDDAGNFLVAWHGPGPSEDDKEDIFARRYYSDGFPVYSEMHVNNHSIDKQLYPAAAVNGHGDFVIVWESANVATEGTKSICGRLYDCNGLALDDEFIVSGQAANSRYPDVAMDDSGGFAVVWMDDSDDNSVMAKLYESDGSVKTEAFKVNTIGFSSVTMPSIAMDSAGFFVIAWDGDPELASMDDIHARLFDPNGIALGEQFRVNTLRDGTQQNPKVAMNDEGQIVIAWEGMPDLMINDRDVFGRCFNFPNEPAGDEFQINTHTENHQRYPAVAIAEDGRIVIVWQSDEQDGSGYGIFGTVKSFSTMPEQE